MIRLADQKPSASDIQGMLEAGVAPADLGDTYRRAFATSWAALEAIKAAKSLIARTGVPEAEYHGTVAAALAEAYVHFLGPIAKGEIQVVAAQCGAHVKAGLIEANEMGGMVPPTIRAILEGQDKPGAVDGEVAREWAGYRLKVVPEDAGAVQVEGCKMAFYGGAWAMFNLLMMIAAEEVDEVKSEARASAIEAELEGFADALGGVYK